MKRFFPAALVALGALGFAGSALADRDHGRDHDRSRYERYYGDRHHDRHHHHDRHYYRYDRPRYYAPPRYSYRYRAPAPYGWRPGWREPYGRGYRYWRDDYYYVVPASPSLELSFSLPLR